MGLIIEDVEVVLTSNIIKYYENFGYKIPRYYDRKGVARVKQGTKIKVKSSDLMKTSTVKVHVECDNCHKIYLLSYIDYNKHNMKKGFYCRDCYRQITMRGADNPNWNKIKTDEERIVQRNTSEYKDFVKKVLLRDKRIYYFCGKQSFKNMEVHHLNGYDWFIEGRTDETNAVCLCSDCHLNFHVLYGRGGNTKKQFEQWINKSIKELEKFNGVLPRAKRVICLDNNEIFYSVIDVSKKYNIIPQQIYDCCNRKKHHKSAKGYHFMWYDEYLTLSNDELSNYINYLNTNERFSKVICKNTNMIFNCAKDAGIYYGNSKMNSSIINCCKGKQSYAGIDSITNEKLVWEYYN